MSPLVVIESGRDGTFRADDGGRRPARGARSKVVISACAALQASAQINMDGAVGAGVQLARRALDEAAVAASMHGCRSAFRRTDAVSAAARRVADDQHEGLWHVLSPRGLCGPGRSEFWIAHVDKRAFRAGVFQESAAKNCGHYLARRSPQHLRWERPARSYQAKFEGHAPGQAPQRLELILAKAMPGRQHVQRRHEAVGGGHGAAPRTPPAARRRSCPDAPGRRGTRPQPCPTA